MKLKKHVTESRCTVSQINKTIKKKIQLRSHNLYLYMLKTVCWHFYVFVLFVPLGDIFKIDWLTITQEYFEFIHTVSLNKYIAHTISSSQYFCGDKHYHLYGHNYELTLNFSK